jgi:hypothetical protein
MLYRSVRVPFRELVQIEAASQRCPCGAKSAPRRGAESRRFKTPRELAPPFFEVEPINDKIDDFDVQPVNGKIDDNQRWANGTLKSSLVFTF